MFSGSSHTISGIWNFGFEPMFFYTFLYHVFCQDGISQSWQWARMHKMGRCLGAVPQEVLQGTFLHFLPAAFPLELMQMPTAQQSGGLLGDARTWIFSNVRSVFIGGLFVFIFLPPGICLRNKAHCNRAIHYYLALLDSRVQRSPQSWKTSLPLFLALWKLRSGDNSIQLKKHHPQRNTSYPV